jgi:hypothetical protein
MLSLARFLSAISGLSLASFIARYAEGGGSVPETSLANPHASSS